MSIAKIKSILIDKGYYSDDHAISSRCIRDIISAYKKVERQSINKKAKKIAIANLERTRNVLLEKKNLKKVRKRKT